MKKNEIPARQIEQMLRAKYRVPEALLRQYRVACADKAVRDGSEIKMNRIYSAVCLSLSRFTESKKDKWGISRLTEFLRYFEESYDKFCNSPKTWKELMKELRDETGIIIRTGEDGDEIYEFGEEE